MRQSITEKIEMATRALANAKPQSRRRHELYFRLRELKLQQLRQEIRGDRKAA